MASVHILLAIFLWSSLGLVVRASSVPVHVLIFYSCMVAAALQGVIVLGRFRSEISHVRVLVYPALLGAVGLVNAFTYYYSFTHTTIANAVLTHYTAPVIVAFLAPVFLKEKISLRIVGAILISSAGLLLMLNGFSLNEGHGIGIASGLVSGLAYAFVIILARITTQGMNPIVLTFLQNVAIVLLLIPFVREFPWHGVWAFALMGVIHSTVAPVLYYNGLRSVTANRAAALGYLEPVSAIIMSMIFLHEVPGLLSVAGGALIIFSGFLTLGGEASGMSPEDAPAKEVR